MKPMSPRTEARPDHQVVSLDAPPRPRRRSSPDGSITILFTDIEGSTEMVDKLGDWAWITLLHSYGEIAREQLEAHGGIEVKHQGDGFMLAFDSPRAAVRFAIAAQRAFADHAAANPVQ